MATIESLDLATLTNNPQSIAEALEDVLEVTSGNIASLKSTAQTDQEHISNTLKPQAQSDADTLSDLVDDAPTADVLNLDLSVNDISSNFTLQSGWSKYNEHFLFFNGFVYWSGYYIHSGGLPTNPETFITIDDSDYRPQTEWRLPSIGHQGDTGSRIEVKANGNIDIVDPTQAGVSNFYIVTSYFWNVNF